MRPRLDSNQQPLGVENRCAIHCATEASWCRPRKLADVVTRTTQQHCARSSPSALTLVVTASSTTLRCGTASGRTRRGAAADGATCRDRTDDYRFHKPGLYR